MPARLFYTGPSLGTLHEEYARKSRIDEQAPLISATSTTIEAPVAEVWAVVSDVAGWPAWYPKFTVLELGEVRPGAPMRWKLGGLTMRSTFAVVNPGHELTWTGRFLGYKAWTSIFSNRPGMAAPPSRSGSRWLAPCSPSFTARANCRPAINGGSPP
jgi:hypothetical protein